MFVPPFHAKISATLSKHNETIVRELQEARDIENSPKRTQNKRSAFEIYFNLARAENSEAQYRLAEILIKKNRHADAFKFMELAAEKEHVLAQCRLGEMYANGEGVEKDESMAIEKFSLAAVHACPRALMHLGVMYMLGHGVEKDVRQGIRNLNRAESIYRIRVDALITKSSVDSIALEKLNEMVRNDQTFGKDVGEASYYLRSATILPTALYLLSINADKDDKHATIYMEQAIKAGFSYQSFKDDQARRLEDNKWSFHWPVLFDQPAILPDFHLDDL